jgi:translation initiation factor IF-3
LSIDFTQKNCDLLNNYNEGQDVEVQYNLRGREWTNPQGNTVIFNTIQGWKIDTATEGVSTSQQAPDRADLPF